jgi:hypothetical protein
MHILSDGLGPNAVTVRRTKQGAALARYTAEWFGALRWETNTALLSRATDLKPVPQY